MAEMFRAEVQVLVVNNVGSNPGRDTCILEQDLLQ